MIIDKKFAIYKRYFFLQCLVATATMALVMYFLTIQNAVVVASIAATCFIVFASPQGYYSRPRNLIGGHFLGVLFGSIFSLLNFTELPMNVIATAMCVGFTFFSMVLIDLEHPPAAGTALGVIFIGFNLKLVIAIMISVIVISAVHQLLKPWMKDLI